MWLKAILLAAATVVPSVLGLNVTTYCDTPAMTPEQLRTYKNVAANITENKRKGIATAKSGYERALIKVYVHVVSASLGWDDGWVKVNSSP